MDDPQFTVAGLLDLVREYGRDKRSAGFQAGAGDRTAEGWSDRDAEEILASVESYARKMVATAGVRASDKGVTDAG
jgi:hypothetical protein